MYVVCAEDGKTKLITTTEDLPEDQQAFLEVFRASIDNVRTRHTYFTHVCDLLHRTKVSIRELAKATPDMRKDMVVGAHPEKSEKAVDDYTAAINRAGRFAINSCKATCGAGSGEHEHGCPLLP
jgi:hypothetical protein